MSYDLFVFAGEKSGDLHGEKLIRSLKALNPAIKIIGVGGPLMRAAGMTCIMPMEEFQVMGFVDVFLTLPKLIRQFYFVADAIFKHNPRAVLFIDYPGFNLRMAKHLRKKNFKGKICHYICPSVWAWGKKRIPLMEKNLDMLLTILPFEKTYFDKKNLKVNYVGHPLIERIKQHPYRAIDIPADKKLIALFPGSRKKEIERNLPIQLKVCSRLKDPNLLFAISVSDSRFEPLIRQYAAQAGLPVALMPADSTYDLMKRANLAIAKSGTVTLELALHRVPTVVTYGISTLDQFIARQILRINLPYYCLVNIIANREVFPELFGSNLNEEALYKQVSQLLAHPEKCLKDCQEIAQILQEKNSGKEAAQHLSKLITAKR